MFPLCTSQSDEKRNIDNYIPISVLNITTKVIEKVAYKQLTGYLKNNNLLCPH